MEMQRQTGREGKAPGHVAPTKHSAHSATVTKTQQTDTNKLLPPTAATPAAVVKKRIPSHTHSVSARLRDAMYGPDEPTRSARVNESTQTTAADELEAIMERVDQAHQAEEAIVPPLQTDQSTNAHESSTFPLTGLARIVDLHPNEKSKIGKLLQEIVALKKEGVQREAAKQALEQTMQQIQEERERTQREAEQLREEMQLYQHQLQTSHSASVRPRSPVRPHESPASVDNPTVNRLLQLNERARAAAAAASPYQPTASHLSTATALPSSSGARPLASILSSLTSSPYRPPLPLPMPAAAPITLPQPATAAVPPWTHQPAPAAAVSASMHLSALGYGTDEERPRSTIPAPSMQTSPVQSRVAQSATLDEIHRAYDSTLADARRSLSPRRRLDLDESPRGSPGRKPFSVSDASLIHPVSPVRSEQPRLSGSASLPGNVTMLPAAVSGVTRALATSSLEQIERRARAPTTGSPEAIERRALKLAQEMYEKKLEEEARSRLDHHQSHRSPRHRSSRHSPPKKSPARSGPPSSLTSFFHSHPLTSQLSPMHSVRGGASRRREREQERESEQEEIYELSPKKHKGRKPKKAPESSPSPRAASASEEDEGQNDPTPESILTHSIRLAESFAASRRERSAPPRNDMNGSSTNGRRINTSAEALDAPIVPESPFSPLLSAPDVAQMTPTTRKIHRLLAIQNPHRIEEQQQHQHQQQREREREEQREKEERSFREKEDRRVREMLEQRKRELAAAEQRAKQSEERLAAEQRKAVAAAAPQEREAERIVVTSPAGTERDAIHSTAAAAGGREDAKSILMRLLPPVHPPQPQQQQRAKTPVETYQPPPFSYRASSRANARPSETESPGSYSNLGSNTTSPATAASSSVVHTPGSAAGDHAPLHTSFTSPFPTRSNMRAAPNTGGSMISEGEYAAEDAEVLELFSLRSPSSLQQQVEDEMVEEMNMRRRGRANANQHQQHQRVDRLQPQSSYAATFAQDMLQAAGTERQNDRPAYVGAKVQPFEYSAAYPMQRDRAFRPSASSIAIPVESGVESKISDLHLRQLERELEDVLPQVMKQLASGRKEDGSLNQTTNIGVSTNDEPGTSRLSQPSAPIAIRRSTQTITHSHYTSTVSSHPAPVPTHPSPSRYKVHARAYQANQARARHRRHQDLQDHTAGEESSIPVSDADTNNTELGNWIDIIDQMQEEDNANAQA